MERCLLCLELKNEFADSIVINSTQWNELNIQNVLEKYLWAMNHIDSTSWICATCWREIYKFHTFYIRIEKVHRDFGLLAKTFTHEEKQDFNNVSTFNEIVGSPINELEERPVEELKDLLNVYDFSVNLFQNDVLNEDQKLMIKDEIDEGLLTNGSILLAKRKRGRPRKNAHNRTAETTKAALKKNQKYKKTKMKDICSKTSATLEKSKITQQNENNEMPIKDDEIKGHDRIDASNSQSRSDCNLIPVSQELELSLDNESYSNNNDTDRESLVNIGITSGNNTKTTNHHENDKFLAENFKIICFLCNIPFETFFSMLKHFEAHHSEPGHVKCCNKKFYRRSILVDHVHYHLNPNYFKCGQCGKVMAARRCLELHAKVHESNHEKEHFCEICGKGFVKYTVLKKHRMIHMSEEEKRFSCTDCGKNFATNDLLSTHYRTVHLKKYVKICDICGKAIRCKDVFERHMLQHEGKTVPPISCEICGLILVDKRALKRHKDVIHPIGGQHEYTCSICSKKSPNLRAHKRHVEYKHLMGYDHKCTICDKAFKRAPALKEHMATHTGTTLYTCPWCPKTFISNANMHNHRKKVHPKEWEEASRKRYSGNLPPNYKPPTVPTSI